MKGKVYETRGLWKQKRVLLLDDSPRLLYIDGKTHEPKGSVPLTEDMEVCYVSPHAFICCPFTHTSSFESI